MTDGGFSLWARCYDCGHRLRFEASGCPQCGEHFDGRAEPDVFPDSCDCERCERAREKEAAAREDLGER